MQDLSYRRRRLQLWRGVALVALLGATALWVVDERTNGNLLLQCRPVNQPAIGR